MLKQDRTSKPAGTVAIIPAAGVGSRMGADRPKQFLYLDGKPLLAVTLLPFQECSRVDKVILVVPSEDVVFCKEKIVEKYGLDKVGKIVPGGKRRQDSVRLGLDAAGDGFGFVLVHDGARPMVNVDLLERAIIGAQTHRAIITGLPAKETVKEIGSLNQVVKTWLVDDCPHRIATLPNTIIQIDSINCFLFIIIKVFNGHCHVCKAQDITNFLCDPPGISIFIHYHSDFLAFKV